jgi:hypothetical protein|uniref:Uncharacterized protein n=1 Tax=Bionectria ochroleuca TaxID=29856 RepID=A0A8H7TMQ3_BIOOC
MLTIGHLLESSEFLVRDPIGALALDGQDAVGGLGAGAFAHRHSRDGGSLSKDFVRLQSLLDMLGEFLGDRRIASQVEGEEFRGFLLPDDTTADIELENHQT